MPENTDENADASTGADVSVDLGGDKPKAQTNDNQLLELQDEPVEGQEPRQETDAGIPKEQIEQEGRKQAKQALNDAHGDSREAQLGAAIRDLEDSIKELSGELQHRRQQASRIETKRSGLSLTIERLEAGADEPDRRFTRELEGGITEEILPDERPEFAEQYRNRREQLGETQEQLEDRCDALSKALERTEYARQELADMQDLLLGTPNDSDDVSDEQLADQLGL